MNRLLLTFLSFGSLSGLCFADERPAETGRAPNVVYIMADELGYFEPGFMGGRNIRTPVLDRMASEGMVFRNMFAGSSVCAPTRCCFLTGRHSGHTSVRSNGGGTPLRADEHTVASLLKPLGYATGGFGKWGCGGRDSTGVPEQHGFDIFLGYYDQVHAHTYFPPYLIRNSDEVVLEGNNGGASGETYSQYVIHEAALDFIRTNQDRPFFAYLPYTPPHGMFSIPDEDPAWDQYKDRPWPEDARRYAAMVTMLDRQTGEVIELLRELDLEDNTLVIFSGDNGGNDYFRSKEHPRGIHSANRHPESGIEYRGTKGTLYEGGLRIPFVARWPGRIAPGTVSNHLGYFPDILPTVLELAGAETPDDIDGISIVPELFGAEAAGRTQEEHDYLYWEIGRQTAIRRNNWRAFRAKPDAAWELYNVAEDPSESDDLAGSRGDILEALKQLAQEAHTPVREGSFSSTIRHERDRRAKFGRHDDPNAQQSGGRRKPIARSAKGLVPYQETRIVSFSSENSGNGKLAANIIDGDLNTWWHSRFTPRNAEPPHELVIDLGKAREITGFVFAARPDGSWNGTVREIEVYVGENADTFPSSPTIASSLKRTRELQRVPCSRTTGRFIRLRILSGHDERPIASLAEFAVEGQ